jgi:hypothetical protein
MRHLIAARAILAAKARPAVYRATADGEAVPARVILLEGAAEVRAGRSQLVSYDAEATVASTLQPVRYGLIEVGATVYRIAEILRASTPGLADLGLERISGPQHADDRYGAAAAAIRVLGRPVMIDGRQIRAQVSSRGIAEETDSGQIVETIRTVLSARVADLDGVAHGAAATVDGEDYRVRVILPDGRGLARVVLE